MLQTKDSFNATNKFTLPKTAASVNNGGHNHRTEHHIGGVASSSKSINDAMAIPNDSALTHTHHLIGEAGIDRKYLSKQLLSQIHFCRFMYKLVGRMSDHLS